jgi:hypothetical protein
MSRNLCITHCAFCNGHIALEEAARPFSKEDSVVHYDEYSDIIVANASCDDCNAKYLAWVWVSENNIFYYDNSPVSDYGFFDLSYRSSFNDEPRRSRSSRL